MLAEQLLRHVPHALLVQVADGRGREANALGRAEHRQQAGYRAAPLLRPAAVKLVQDDVVGLQRRCLPVFREAQLLVGQHGRVPQDVALPGVAAELGKDVGGWGEV